TKAAGERQAQTHAADAIILRTAWVYASTGRNFATTMLRLMKERNEVRVVADQIGTPTWAASVAHGIWGLMRMAPPSGGIYHWTDSGLATWYDFAVAIQDEAVARGILARAVPIIPIATSEYPTPARRPAFSVLDSESTRAAIGVRPRHWRHSLGMMLDDLRTA
ncbi:MAG: sugar nucleotide-binding protein, partial [Pseudomonadota bacterium]|nr:sugar nucleotide-binding protein [Pseudomonadota bacterium]